MAIPAYYSLIQRGSSGPDVALVQTWLNGIRDSCTWHAALTVDGKFGANAEKAVREFQLRYGLKEDGKVGANTWNVLYARYTAKHGLTDDKSGKYLTDHLGSLALLRKKSHQLCGYQDYRQILKAIYHNMISFLSLISDFTP